MTSLRIQQELECPICLERFNRPKVLPCQHTFCATCLDGLYERGGVRCAECRAIHHIPADGFPTNVTIQRLLTASEIIPTINEPESETRAVIPARAPQFQPSPSRLPPVYPIPHQPAQEIPPPYVLPPQPARNHQAARQTDIGNTSEHGDNFDQCKTTFLKYFRITRNGVREIISSFLRKYKPFMAAIIAYFMLITISRFIAGAVKLSSDCPKERKVAVYLFVKSIFGFIFWGILLLLGVKKKLMNAMDNRFIEVYVVIESLFTLIWLIIGTVRTMGFRDEMTDECPFYIEGWNKHFINFAMFLTVVDWIGVVAFIFYCCYIQFDNSNDNETEIIRYIQMQYAQG